MNIQLELNKLILRKRGNNEIAVFCVEGEWRIMLGNPCKYVMLGEEAGEFESSGASIEDCIISLNCMLDILYGN